MIRAPKILVGLRYPVLFSSLVNLNNLLQGKKYRTKWNAKHAHFIFFDGPLRRCASFNSRVLTYNDGFDKRAEYLNSIYFLDEIEFNPQDLVIDCGANMGDLSLALRKKCNEIVYVGIEPNPGDFAALMHNNPQDEIYNLGLWNEDDSIDFFLDQKTASSSFVEPKNYIEIKKIQAQRGDTLFTNRLIKLFKLEAEGAEPEVLMGLEGILKNIKYISADVGPERGVHEELTRDECVKFLESRNFKIVKEKTHGRRIVLFENKNWGE
jgi:FkbM family methyltransferase